MINPTWTLDRWTLPLFRTAGLDLNVAANQLDARGLFLPNYSWQGAVVAAGGSGTAVWWLNARGVGHANTIAVTHQNANPLLGMNTDGNSAVAVLAFTISMAAGANVVYNFANTGEAERALAPFRLTCTAAAASTPTWLELDIQSWSAVPAEQPVAGLNLSLAWPNIPYAAATTYYNTALSFNDTVAWLGQGEPPSAAVDAIRAAYGAGNEPAILSLGTSVSAVSIVVDDGSVGSASGEAGVSPRHPNSNDLAQYTMELGSYSAEGMVPGGNLGRTGLPNAPQVLWRHARNAVYIPGGWYLIGANHTSVSAGTAAITLRDSALWYEGDGIQSAVTRTRGAQFLRVRGLNAGLAAAYPSVRTHQFAARLVGW